MYCREASVRKKISKRADSVEIGSKIENLRIVDSKVVKSRAYNLVIVPFMLGMTLRLRLILMFYGSMNYCLVFDCPSEML